MDNIAIIAQLDKSGAQKCKEEAVKKLIEAVKDYLKEQTLNYVAAVREVYKQYDDSVLFVACTRSIHDKTVSNFVDGYIDLLEKRLSGQGTHRHDISLKGSSVLPQYDDLYAAFLLEAFGGKTPEKSQPFLEAEEALRKVMASSRAYSHDKNKACTKDMVYKGEVFMLSDDDYDALQPHLGLLSMIDTISVVCEDAPVVKKARTQ